MGINISNLYYQKIWPLLHRPLTLDEFYRLKDQEDVVMKIGAKEYLTIAYAKMQGQHNNSSAHIIITEVIWKGNQSKCASGQRYGIQFNELYTEREFPVLTGINMRTPFS